MPVLFSVSTQPRRCEYVLHLFLMNYLCCDIISAVLQNKRDYVRECVQVDLYYDMIIVATVQNGNLHIRIKHNRGSVHRSENKSIIHNV